MDSYVDLFQAAGGSLRDAGQGQPLARRSPTPAQRHGGFYLGSIGGPAARLAQDCIRKVEVLEYPELGMEAVWRIEVEDFPAFIVVDDKGNDFFREVSTPVARTYVDRSIGPVPVPTGTPMSPIAAIRSRRTIDDLPGAADAELLAWSRSLLAPAPPRRRRTEPLRAHARKWRARPTIGVVPCAPSCTPTGGEGP